MRGLIIGLAIAFSQPALSKSCTVQFSNGMEIKAPVALSKADQVKGLSGTETAASSLIMAWSTATMRAVWMKDTHIPLTAAFIGPDGIIQSIQDMAPETETVHSSLHPVIAILEVPRAVSEQLKWKRGQFVTYSSCFAVPSNPRAADKNKQ